LSKGILVIYIRKRWLLRRSYWQIIGRWALELWQPRGETLIYDNNSKTCVERFVGRLLSSVAFSKLYLVIFITIQIMLQRPGSSVLQRILLHFRLLITSQMMVIDCHQTWFVTVLEYTTFAWIPTTESLICQASFNQNRSSQVTTAQSIVDNGGRQYDLTYPPCGASCTNFVPIPAGGAFKIGKDAVASFWHLSRRSLRFWIYCSVHRLSR